TRRPGSGARDHSSAVLLLLVSVPVLAGETTFRGTVRLLGECPGACNATLAIASSTETRNAMCTAPFAARAGRHKVCIPARGCRALSPSRTGVADSEKRRSPPARAPCLTSGGTPAGCNIQGGLDHGASSDISRRSGRRRERGGTGLRGCERAGER